MFFTSFFLYYAAFATGALSVFAASGLSAEFVKGFIPMKCLSVIRTEFRKSCDLDVHFARSPSKREVPAAKAHVGVLIIVPIASPVPSIRAHNHLRTLNLV